MFRSVNVIQVPAVFDKSGHLKCATTSTYPAQCPDLPQKPTPLPISGINSNAELYFSPGPKIDSAILSSKFDMVSISFSTPFVYAPLSDPFPSKVVNENLGYVPQNLIEWIAQQPDYVSEVPGIATCLPGGPSIAFYDYSFCPPSDYHIFFQINLGASDLTVSSTVTVAGRGCFHPGACPTPAAPGAAAAATTPLVTPEALPQSGMPDSCCLQQILNMLLTVRSSTFPKSSTSTNSGSPIKNARQHSSTVSPKSSG